MELILYALGAITGIIIMVFVNRKRTVGDLRVDRSEPDEPPMLFLELRRGISDISASTYVVLRVKNEDFLSQK